MRELLVDVSSKYKGAGYATRIAMAITNKSQTTPIIGFKVKVI